METEAIMRNKAVSFTRVEGGTKVPVPFEIYEDELIGYSQVLKKDVFSQMFKKPIKTRVVKIDKVFVHALFFEDGLIYDVYPEGFRLRELEGVAVR